MNITESIKIAVESIRMNKLRASLTLLSISIGVFAIIASGTLVDSMDRTVVEEMSSLGENSFSIYRIPKVHMGRHNWWKYRKRKPITYEQVQQLKREMQTTKFVSANSQSSAHVIKWGNNETDPDVTLVGTDENYFVINDLGISEGRAFSEEDINYRRNVAIVGNDVVVKIFPNEDPIGKEITIGNYRFNVIGVLEKKGAILGQSQDNKVIIPITYFLRYYSIRWEQDLDINIKAYNRQSLMPTLDEAIGHMRVIRDVKPWEENSFEIATNESITEQFSDLTKFLTIFGIVSGVVALFVAGVGIMNIMLVSVKERTREIGIRKAVGAKRLWILNQFIIETITLCQIGGLIGIILGFLAAWGASAALNLNIFITPTWLIVSIAACTAVGVVAGAYPAWKAAGLDPIDALRYE